MTLRDDARLQMRTRIVRVIRESTGLLEQFAVPIADQVLDVVVRDVDGQALNRTDREFQEQRDRLVLAAFTGRNRDEVCKTFGISRPTFYRILKRRPSNGRGDPDGGK